MRKGGSNLECLSSFGLEKTVGHKNRKSFQDCCMHVEIVVGKVPSLTSWSVPAHEHPHSFEPSGQELFQDVPDVASCGAAAHLN